MSIRKYRRAIAHARMERAGVAHPNRPLLQGKSYFALTWRKWLAPKEDKG